MARTPTSGRVEIRDNSIRIKFTYEGERCAETVRIDGKVLLPTSANVKFARRLANDVQKAIDTGTFDYAEHFPDSARAVKPAPQREQVFRELAALWLQSKGRLTGATKDQYGTAVRFWTRIFGAETPVRQIDHKLAEAKIGSYPWKSAKQHNNYMIALRGIFRMEYRGSRAALAPIAEIENMPVVKKKPDPLTRDERDRVLAEMNARFDRRVYAYFLFAFYCGMRPEEIIALRWGDIDLAAGTARVQRVRTFRGAEREGSKTHAERDVDLVPQALKALEIMRAYTGGHGKHTTEVFQNPVTGEPWHDERSQRDHYWKPTLEVLGIRARRAYCARHTYCTVALMAGVPPAYIAAQAGHSVKMLLEVYARWIPSADGGAAKRMLAAAMGDLSLECPQKETKNTKSLIPKGKIGRRDWTRTNDPHHVKVVL